MNFIANLKSLCVAESDHTVMSINKGNGMIVDVWFWKHFNFKTHSIWIGQMNSNMSSIKDVEALKKFIDVILMDLKTKIPENEVYIKIYLAKNYKTSANEINFLMVSINSELPEIYKSTLLSGMFEIFKLTEDFLNMDKNLKKLMNHYLLWSNFYNYQNLIQEYIY